MNMDALLDGTSTNLPTLRSFLNTFWKEIIHQALQFGLGFGFNLGGGVTDFFFFWGGGGESPPKTGLQETLARVSDSFTPCPQMRPSSWQKHV